MRTKTYVIALISSILLLQAGGVAGADFGSSELGSSELAPMMQHAPAGRRFYVRGDVGVGRYHFDEFSQADLADNGGSFLTQGLGDAGLVGAGLGWQLGSKLRVDLTGEYRSTADIQVLDTVLAELQDPAGSLQANTLYQGQLSGYVGLVNGYWDIARVGGFTPYVGAGIGVAQLTVSDVTTLTTATLTDAATGVPTVQLTPGTSDDKSTTTFAWAMMAGTSYALAPDAKLDLGYRYVNFGSGVAASSSLLDCVCGTTGQPLEVNGLDAHELRVGVRWELGATRNVAYEPLK